MMRALLTPSLAIVLLSLPACGGGAVDPRHPSRPEGCEVQLFHDAPSMPTDNLGPVQATCEETVPEADCLRTLKDQACKLGGDVVWGVPDEPTKLPGKLRWSGRAAHKR